MIIRMTPITPFESEIEFEVPFSQVHTTCRRWSYILSSIGIVESRSRSTAADLHVRITDLHTDAHSEAAVVTMTLSNALIHSVEYSVDGAAERDAIRVDFDGPIVAHAENYLGLP